MRKVLLLVLLGLFSHVSATRIRNKSDVAITFGVMRDFAYEITVLPGQDGVVPLPKVNNVDFVVRYRGADPRYSGLVGKLPYSVWRWGVPEIIDIYLDPIVEERQLGVTPQRTHRFSIDTTQRRERGYRESLG